MKIKRITNNLSFMLLLFACFILSACAQDKSSNSKDTTNNYKKDEIHEIDSTYYTYENGVLCIGDIDYIWVEDHFITTEKVKPKDNVNEKNFGLYPDVENQYELYF